MRDFRRPIRHVTAPAFVEALDEILITTATSDIGTPTAAYGGLHRARADARGLPANRLAGSTSGIAGSDCLHNIHPPRRAAPRRVRVVAVDQPLGFLGVGEERT